MKKLFVMILSAALFTLLFVVPAQTQTRDISGQLAPTVESGGWLIVNAKDKYLLLNAERFRRASWFKEGAAVTAIGEIKRDVVTIYQEGIPFEAQSLKTIDHNPAGATTPASRGSMTITVSGEARVSVPPDTAILFVSVVTQNNSAVEAQQLNATKTTTVIAALRNTAGSGAEIKTSGYQLIPQRVYRENQPPTITGYEARNNITVTTSDLNRVGAIIDAAAKAGANNIENVSFTLRRDRAAREQALAEAAREAVSKANALAQALGGRILRIIAVEEGGATPRPVIYAQREALAAQTAETPIEIGTIEIDSQVRLIAETESGQPR